MTNDERARAVGMLEAGVAARQVAATINVSHTAINKLRQKWLQLHTTERLPGTGRQKVTTEEEDRVLVERIQQHPFETAAEAKEASGFPASVRTARRRISVRGLRNRAAEIKEVLLDRHRYARIQYAEAQLHRPDDFWDNVIFVDEKTWQSTKSGKVKVYRPDNTRYDPRYVCQRPRSGRFSVHSWAWMSIAGPGVIWSIDGNLTGAQYTDILRDVMMPSVTIAHQNDFWLLQDNSPIHTSRIVRDWIGEQQFHVLPHPARSPDLNPIENLWGIAQRTIETLYDVPPRNRDELWDRVQNAWEQISVDCCQNTIRNMPRRLRQVLERQGNWTDF